MSDPGAVVAGLDFAKLVGGYFFEGFFVGFFVVTNWNLSGHSSLDLISKKMFPVGEKFVTNSH